MSSNDRDDAESYQLPEFIDHPQLVGLAGVALALIGSAFLLAGTSRVDVLMAGYNLGAGTILITYEVFKP